MAVQTDRSWQDQGFIQALRRRIRPVTKFLSRLASQYRFSSLTRRIVFLNIFGLAILLSGNLYLNQFRAGLIDAKVKSLETQGQIIAAAIAGSASVKTDGIVIEPEDLLELQSGQHSPMIEEELSSLEFTIDPQKVAPVLRHLIQPTGTRARLYNRDGSLILDSRSFYSRGRPLSSGLPDEEQDFIDVVAGLWQRMTSWFLHRDLPLYEEIGYRNGKFYSEVETAMAGISTPIVRVNVKGELVISIAVPVQRLRSVRGVLLLSAQGGEIDAILRSESYAIGQFALVAFGVTILLSVLLAGQIAGPMRRLSAAAERVRKSIKAREEIPDFTDRSDEIGHLSGALRDMTSALYRRLDAIESFAADVSHELKNPMTSLRSAAETLTYVKGEKERERLIEIIQHDVGRLDRLITDISDASRLDAELGLADSELVDMEDLIRSLVGMFNDLHMKDGGRVLLEIGAVPKGKSGYMVSGHPNRLGQVFNNILDNALSFSPDGGRVRVKAVHLGKEIEIRIEDEGPGIDPAYFDKIFERFYTDRPGGEETFGRNSGLGLNISRQIVVAHHGRIWAENRMAEGAVADTSKARKAALPIVDEATSRLGACIVVRLPAV